MEKISSSQLEATEQMVQSAEGLNQQTKNVTKNSCSVAEGAEKLEKESKELMERVSKFKV